MDGESLHLAPCAPDDRVHRTDVNIQVSDLRDVINHKRKVANPSVVHSVSSSGHACTQVTVHCYCSRTATPLPPRQYGFQRLRPAGSMQQRLGPRINMEEEELPVATCNATSHSPSVKKETKNPPVSVGKSRGRGKPSVPSSGVFQHTRSKTKTPQPASLDAQAGGSQSPIYYDNPSYFDEGETDASGGMTSHPAGGSVGLESDDDIDVLASQGETQVSEPESEHSTVPSVSHHLVSAYMAGDDDAGPSSNSDHAQRIQSLEVGLNTLSESMKSLTQVVLELRDRLPSRTPAAANPSLEVSEEPST